jgi:hypothetical protein
VGSGKGGRTAQQVLPEQRDAVGLLLCTGVQRFCWACSAHRRAAAGWARASSRGAHLAVHMADSWLRHCSSLGLTSASSSHAGGSSSHLQASRPTVLCCSPALGTRAAAGYSPPTRRIAQLPGVAARRRRLAGRPVISPPAAPDADVRRVQEEAPGRVPGALHSPVVHAGGRAVHGAQRVAMVAVLQAHHLGWGRGGGWVGGGRWQNGSAAAAATRQFRPAGTGSGGPA